MTNTLVLYRGEHCPLCDKARELIYQVLPGDCDLREVDVRSDPALNERYGLRIPVVEVNGQEKGWPFTAGQLRRLLGM